MSSSFAELAARSAFSFLEGSTSPRDLVAVAARLEIGSLGLCDRNGLYGAVAFIDAARHAGIRPVVGVELDLVDGGRLRLLARSRRGYRQLSRTISGAQLAGVKGQPRLRIAGLTGEGSGGPDHPLLPALGTTGMSAVPTLLSEPAALAPRPRRSRRPTLPPPLTPGGPPPHRRPHHHGLAVPPLDPRTDGRPAGGGRPRRPRRLRRPGRRPRQRRGGGADRRRPPRCPAPGRPVARGVRTRPGGAPRHQPPPPPTAGSPPRSPSWRSGPASP